MLYNFSGKLVVKQNERIKSEISKLVQDVIKECKITITKLKKELEKADQSLKETESFYQKDEVMKKLFQDKISSIKSKKDKLEVEIFENKARITQMNNFNDEVLRILKQLDDDVKKYVKEVAAFREEITKEKLELLKDMANKDKDLAKQKENVSIKEKENESLRKEVAKLLIQIESLQRNQKLSNDDKEKCLNTSYKDVVIADRPTKLQKSYNSLSLDKQTKETMKKKSEFKAITLSTKENKKNLVNTSKSG